MKKASFIIGLIGSILGIIGCGILLLTGLGMLVTNPETKTVITTSILGLLFSIGALVGVCINNKKKMTGILIILGALTNILSGLYSIPADNPLTFIICLITMILLFISGIMRLCEKE